MDNPPVFDPGWVLEVDPGKDAFEEAFTYALHLLLNSVNFNVFIADSTTVDPNDTCTINGHATNDTTFANDVTANVSDLAGNSAILEKQNDLCSYGPALD